MTIRQTMLTGLVLLLPMPARVEAQFVAEQVTVLNASARLFGGTDADGGIDDWYVSNGVVEAIIDDVGPQPDLVALLGANAPPKQSEAAFTGGSLLDLGLLGANNDQLVQLFTVAGLSTSNFILYDSISASTTASSATITATGTQLGFNVPPQNLVVESQYSAVGTDPFFTITTAVKNTHPTDAAVGLGGFLDAMLWTLRATVPFSPLPNRGFRHAVFDLSNPALALELPPFAAGPGVIGPGAGVMDPESGTAAGEVSYGLLGVEVSVDQDGAGGNPPVVTNVNTLFGVNNNLVTALGHLPATGSLNPGGVVRYTRRLYVGGRNDVASVANGMIAELATRQAFATGTISGNVDANDTPDVAASVIATRTGGPSIPGFPAGTPATHYRTDGSGAFDGVVLPVGTYDLEFRAVERDPLSVSGVTVAAASDTPVTVPPMTGLGTLNVSVFERVPGPDVQVPAKVTFTGIKGSSDPVFNKDFEAFVFPASGPDVDLMPETFGAGPAQRNFLYLADGSETVQLRPGRYELVASRGPEYTVKRRRVIVREGRTSNAHLRIRRVVDTAGALSGDFHIHSARSLDSSAALRDRVTSFAGEGVEVMVSTDHDYHLDYASTIAALGIGSHVAAVVGNEVTTSVPNPPGFPNAIGHINAWPVPVDSYARRDGSIEDEFVAPNFIYSRLRSQGAEVVQYNHPRAGVSGLTVIGFFRNIGYDPDVPITSPPNDVLLDDDITGASGVPNPDGFRNIDFDVMEIANGTEIPGYLAVRRDWLSLLNQTNLATPSGPVPFIPGTAVSDSHRITLESAGYFRTYVRGAGDDPAALNVTAFDQGVKAGNTIGTSGPFVDFSIEDPTDQSAAGLGQTLAPASGDVRLKIHVQATNWIPVEEVRVIANGFVTMTFDATTTPAVRPAPLRPFAQNNRRVTRFEAEIPVTVSVDSYFIVEAGAKLSPLPAPPAFLDRIVPGLIPLAFTNPIFVDLAGDGFDPPGLPVMASASGVGEELPAFACVVRRDQRLLVRAGEWWRGVLATVGRPNEALACNASGQTDPALAQDLEEEKKRPSPEYFPLYQFRIPESAIDEAIDGLPEAERDRVRRERQQQH